MRRIVFFFLLVLSSRYCSAQFHIGLRDTRYIYGYYKFKNELSLGLEHSVYSDNLSFQKIRLFAGYNFLFNNFDISVNPYFSSIWNGQYIDYGVRLKCIYQIFDVWKIDAVINPHYDSGLQYDTFYSFGTSLRIYKDINMIVRYTNLPVYRESEKALRIGFQFKVTNLQVFPELAMTKIGLSKSLRVLCGMDYSF